MIWRYSAPKEIGSAILTDRIVFNVNDQEGNSVKDQVLTINIEPMDNQAPVGDIVQPARVLEGGFLILNESLIRVKDSDSLKEQLNVVIDSQPSFGYIENIKKGSSLISISINLILFPKLYLKAVKFLDWEISCLELWKVIYRNRIKVFLESLQACQCKFRI